MKLPVAYRNWISLFGTYIAIASLFSIVLLYLVSTFGTFSGTYLGLVLYVVIPFFLISGLILIPIGMALKREQMRKNNEIEDSRWPKFDLEEKGTRNAAFIFVSFTLIFGVMTIFGSYQAYHYSESIEFCGKLCHTIMTPEFATYQNSPHAKVKCVECHVGEGAEWMVKAKINGTRQLFKTMLNTFPRPIPTPVTSLRPARETCEKCHWPQKFYDPKMVFQSYYIADSVNTNWKINLKMNIGAEQVAQGLSTGIHWHINPNVKVEYIHFDQKREDIFWVKYTNNTTGKVTIYKDEENVIKDDSIQKMSPRLMDCMDCHNRPSHNYKSPVAYIDNLFNTGEINKDIPYLKLAAIKSVNAMESTLDSTFMLISDRIKGFYKDGYPAIWGQQEKAITASIPEIQKAYALNAFPEMKVSYREYSNHIGHIESKGCFRCHDNKHKSEDGRIISKDCNLCHTILGQGKGDNMTYSKMNESQEFIHPVDVKDAWKEYNCSECHAELFP